MTLFEYICGDDFDADWVYGTMFFFLLELFISLKGLWSLSKPKY